MVSCLILDLADSRIQEEGQTACAPLCRRGVRLAAASQRARPRKLAHPNEGRVQGESRERQCPAQALAMHARTGIRANTQ